MRKIIVTEYMTLDGIMESPAWTAPYWNDEVQRFKEEEDEMTDALLLGRVTYQEFAAAWPDSDDEGAARINSVPKHVVSSTLDTLTWNNSRLVKGDLVQEITKLKQQEGEGLLVYGSATLAQALLKHQLVDSVRLLIYPVVMGRGKRLFSEDLMATFELADSRTISGGVVGLVYTPKA